MIAPVDKPRAIVISAANAKFYDLLDEMIRSIREFFDGSELPIGCMDLGLEAEQVAALREQGVQAAQPITRLTAPDGFASGKAMAYLARPYLPEMFPGYDVYIWMDADAWIQSRQSIEELISAATRAGAVFVRENGASYKHPPRLFLWKAKHYLLGYGAPAALQLLLKEQINNGVFAMERESPVWARWRTRYQSAFDRTATPAPHDQFALNAAVYLDGAPCQFLPATFNWICDLSRPKKDPANDRFCTPDDHQPIHVVHLAGDAKKGAVEIETTDGRRTNGWLRYGHG